jgi:hypothetical protein
MEGPLKKGPNKDWMKNIEEKWRFSAIPSPGTRILWPKRVFTRI